MSELWKPQPVDVYKSWADALETEASDKLTNWESSFCANIRMRLDSGYNLTEAQAECLEKLYVRYTS